MYSISHHVYLFPSRMENSQLQEHSLMKSPAFTTLFFFFFFLDPKIGRWGLEMVHSWVIRGGEQLSLNSFFDLSSPFLFNLTQLSPSLLNSPNFFFVPQNGRRGPEMVCPVIIWRFEQLSLNRFLDGNTPLMRKRNIGPRQLSRSYIAYLSERPSLYLLDSPLQEVINNNPILATLHPA